MNTLHSKILDLMEQHQLVLQELKKALNQARQLMASPERASIDRQRELTKRPRPKVQMIDPITGFEFDSEVDEDGY